MRFLIKATGLLIFLFTIGYAYAYRISGEEILFTREYREYGWKDHDANGRKFPHPIQTLVDFYSVEYRLNDTRLVIEKVMTGRKLVNTVLSVVQLSRVQRQTTKRLLHTTNFARVQEQCSHIITDDGFHLDVTSVEHGVNKSFRWNGNNVPELMEFLDVINQASPEKYKFYKESDKNKFKVSLQEYSE